MCILSSVSPEMIKMIYWHFLIILIITIAQFDMKSLTVLQLVPLSNSLQFIKTAWTDDWTCRLTDVCVLSPGQMCVLIRRWSLWPRCSRVSRPSHGWLKPGNKDARDSPGAWDTRGGGTDIHILCRYLYENINVMYDQSATILPYFCDI